MACLHDYVGSLHESYLVCLRCGTYHSLAAQPPWEIYGHDYWSGTHSTIRDQVYNVDEHLEGGFSKNAFMLAHITDKGRGMALEIGCAPGKLMQRLREDSGFRCVFGIDTDPAYCVDMVEIGGSGGPFLFGYFPEVAAILPDAMFDLVISCDVIEHSFTPEAFLRECYRLLKPGGQLLLMCPILMDGEAFDVRFLHPVEHVYLHSQNNLAALLQEAGFEGIGFDRWCLGHETVSARRRIAA